MAFPFTTRIPGRDYYGVALPEREPETAIWSSGSQPVPHPYSEQLARLGIVSVGAAAVFGAGFLHAGEGRNVFSRYYLPAFRSIEEYSPGRVLRTFQLSNFFSQFATESRLTRFLPAETLLANESVRQYYSRLVGRDLSATLLTERGGLVFHQGALYFGKGPKDLGEQLLSSASVIINKKGGASRLSEGIARTLGVEVPFQESIWDPFAGAKGIFSQATRWIDEAGQARHTPMQIVGGRTAAEHAWLQARGFGAAFVERFNLLSRSFPREFIPGGLSDKIKRLGIDPSKLHLGVTPGPALKTLGKMAGKWGVVGGGLYFGYDFIDYLGDKLLGMGPTKIGASAYVGARITAASIADVTGLSSIPRAQEEVAPGSTDLLKLMAFPMMGAIAGLSGHYLQGVGLQARLQSGVQLSDELWNIRSKLKPHPSLPYQRMMRWDVDRASRVSQRVMESFGPGHPGWVNSLGRWLKDKEIFSGVFETKLFDKPWKIKAGAGAVAGLALVLPFLPGALLPEQSAEELRQIYSGEKEVPIRRGRWWEMGRTPWEGQNISYFRPHWYPLLMSDARDTAIYGERKSAIEKFFLANFTYELERKNYYTRPYPITGTAFEDFPLISPILAATIGRIIKPPLTMHEEEYMRDGEYMHQPLGFGERRAFELGELEPGTPISPYGEKGVFGEQIYRLQEMGGLWGYIPGAIKQAITGEEGFFTQEQQLESARRMYGVERNIWDRELGGGLGVGEILRRIFPHRRREVPLYNPIRNMMPNWLPGPGERSPDFLHGDPYTKVPMGDVRLPGPGFESLHPELSGLSPEEYPDIYKFKILADVAPYAEQTQIYKSIIEAKRRAGALGEFELNIYEQSVSNLKAIRDKKEFFEYKYEGETPLTPWGMLGKYWETLAHGAMTPLEFLTPVSPASKFIHMRTATEDYQNSILYGTQNAFWSNPIKNFLAPFTTSTAAALGWQGMPQNVKEVRAIEQYFDALEYIKFTRLKEIAEANRDYSAAAEFGEKRQETLVGVNPYTHTYAHIFRALPRRERDYFTAFSEEDDPDKQAEILSMVPENQRGLLIARWKMARAQDLRKQAKTDKLSGDAEAFVDEVYAEARRGGVPMDRALNAEYLATREPGESYPDWYRRTKLLPEALEGRAVPGPDWVGWHPAVDLDDIKLKLVENLGFDMHDFDLWPSDRMNLARRPFINDQAIREISPDISMSDSEIRVRVKDLLHQYQMEDVDITVAMYPSDRTSYNVDLDITNDRSEEIREVYKRGI